MLFVAIVIMPATSNAFVEFDVHTPHDIIHREDSTFNSDDSLVGLILGWHGKKFHQMFGPELFIPSGKFSDDRLTNTSRGYFSIGPSYWFTRQKSLSFVRRLVRPRTVLLGSM